LYFKIYQGELEQVSRLGKVEKLKLKYAMQQKYFGRFVQNTNHRRTKTIDFLTFCFRGRGISSRCRTAFLPLSEKN
jgi:hypothetical protein